MLLNIILSLCSEMIQNNGVESVNVSEYKESLTNPNDHLNCSSSSGVSQQVIIMQPMSSFRIKDEIEEDESMGKGEKKTKKNEAQSQNKEEKFVKDKKECKCCYTSFDCDSIKLKRKKSKKKTKRIIPKFGISDDNSSDEQVSSFCSLSKCKSEQEESVDNLKDTNCLSCFCSKNSEDISYYSTNDSECCDGSCFDCSCDCDIEGCCQIICCCFACFELCDEKR